jgi:hypothetical protein
MKKSTSNTTIARGFDPSSDLDAALPASPGEVDMSSAIATAFSRRSFLYGLGALSLSACGGGEESAAEASVNSAAADRAEVQAVSSSAPFVHPGLLHTDSDFARMKAKLAVNASPWIDDYKKLTANRHAQLAYAPHPQTVIYRNDGVHGDNFMAFAEDVAAAYSLALRWRIENDNAYADKAVQIMNAWSSQLTGINTTDGHYDGFLVAGIQGYQFANAGEIMRSYSGWAATDFARFQNMMRKVFYPMNAGFITAPAGTLVVYSSWDLCAMAAVMAIGVLCDDRTMFNAAITYFKSGFGNGAVAQTVYYIHPGYLGQTQESGRDQGHNTLSISLLTSICEMAWNQGFDLYGYDNNRVLAAAEYVARGNLIQSGTTYYAMPFATYWNGSVTDTVFSTDARGLARAEWALIYNHYANRQGLAAPYTKKFAALVAPEGGNDDYGFSSGAYDQLGYGTLTCTRDPLTTPDRVPSGLTAVVSGGKVILSWWGSARATSYRVWRSTTSTGGYRPLTPTVTEPLTFTDSGLAPGKYYYCVSAVISSGQTVSETALSSAVTAVTSVEPYIVLPFNDGSGSTAADSTGGGHPGHLMNANWTSGRKASSSAAAFNGSSSYVALPTGVLTSIADFTISAWVYWNGVSNWERVFDFGTGVRQYMYLTPRRDTGVACFGITANGGVGAQEILGSASLPAGQWVHVAVTLSGNVGTLYVNGRAAGTNTAMQFAPFRLGNTAQNWIGRSQYATDPYFNGKICDFRIYHGALSAAQIAALISA